MSPRKVHILLFLAVAITACNTQPSQVQEPVAIDSDYLQVYYFHYSKRCATCNAIENESLAALDMFYSVQMKEGNLAFVALNLDEEDGKKLAEQLQVSGQSLLLVKGDKMVNLTNEGFMNARTNPGKFHEILKTNIDQML